MSQLEVTTLSNEGLHERALQDLIDRNRDSTLAEIDESGLTLLKPERLASESLKDRIDLLGIDTDGTAVIIELKRGKHKLHMLQALSYAAMIANRPAQWFIDQLTQAQLSDIVENDPEIKINYRQRIILIAEQFEPQVIAAARWLHNFGIQVKCIELGVAADPKESRSLYLKFTQIYPGIYINQAFPSEAGKIPTGFEGLTNDLNSYLSSTVNSGNKARLNKNRNETEANTDIQPDWPRFISQIKNKHLSKFIIEWNEKGEKILPDSGFRMVFPRRGERWRIQPRPDYGWVMQTGRFFIEGMPDIDYWKKVLNSPDSVKLLREGKRVHFNLISESDFRVFRDLINDSLSITKLNHT